MNWIILTILIVYCLASELILIHLWWEGRGTNKLIEAIFLIVTILFAPVILLWCFAYGLLNSKKLKR
jgi:hypothetical protein